MGRHHRVRPSNANSRTDKQNKGRACDRRDEKNRVSRGAKEKAGALTGRAAPVESKGKESQKSATARYRPKWTGVLSEEPIGGIKVGMFRIE